MPMIMHIVLFSGPSESTMAIVFAIVSVIHLVFSFVVSAVTKGIVKLFTKRKTGYWPVFISAFLFGEAYLWLSQHQEQNEDDGSLPFFLVYAIVMMFGLACGIFISLAKNKDHDKTQS